MEVVAILHNKKPFLLITMKVPDLEEQQGGSICHYLRLSEYLSSTMFKEGANFVRTNAKS